MSKTPTEIKSLARAHTESAITTLARVMTNRDSPPAAQVSAAQALLDRGWGKPTQPIAGDDERAPVRMIITGVTRAQDLLPPSDDSVPIGND